MSAQSGIAPSESLLDSFKEFTKSNHSILIAEIVSKESVELSDIITDLSIQSGFITLASKLNDTTSRYIIIKNKNSKKTTNSFTLISFVPDYAPVKDKMIYASSKHRLLKSFGSEFFSHTLFWNDLREVTYGNWSSAVNDDDKRGALSHKEHELQKLKDLEFDTLVQSTAAKKKLVGPSNDFSFKFHENTDFEIQENVLYSYNLDIDDEQIFLSNTTEVSTPRQIISSISEDYPQYNLVNYKGKVIFIYSCPSGSKVKERMVYASNKQGMINHLKKSIEIKKSLEVGDAYELELSEFEKQPETKFSSTNETAVKFNRPLRPGRRR